MAKKKKVEEKKVVETKKKDTKNTKEAKQSLYVRFRIFMHGVKTEFKKINWPSKYDTVKYSLATIFFVVILSLFFWSITTVFEIILKAFA